MTTETAVGRASVLKTSFGGHEDTEESKDQNFIKEDNATPPVYMTISKHEKESLEIKAHAPKRASYSPVKGRESHAVVGPRPKTAMEEEDRQPRVGTWFGTSTKGPSS